MSLYDDSNRLSHRYGHTGPGKTLILVSFIGVSICFLLLLNRFIWRYRIAKLGWDDFFTFLAWILLFVLGIVSYKAVDCGYGRPQQTLTRRETSHALRMFYIYQILYKACINTSKLSILAIYLRVFGQTDPRRSWFPATTYTLIFIIASYTFASVTANIFQCLPVSANWDTSSPSKPRKCIDQLSFWYANALYNIITETIILFSAIVRIWSLAPAPSTSASHNSNNSSAARSPLTRRDKYSLSIVFMLGFFTIITAILRMTTLSATTSSDKSAGTLLSTIWSTVEASMAIVCANLPMLRIIFKECRWRWVRRWLGGERGGRRARYRGSYDESALQPWGPHAISVQRTSMSAGSPMPSPMFTDSHTYAGSRDEESGHADDIIQRDRRSKGSTVSHYEFITMNTQSSPNPNINSNSNDNSNSAEVRDHTIDLLRTDSIRQHPQTPNTVASSTMTTATTATAVGSPPPTEPASMIRVSNDPPRLSLSSLPTSPLETSAASFLLNT